MTQPLDLERAEKRLSEVAVALAHLSCGMALGAAYGHARSPEKVLAGDLRNLLDALSSERAAREEAEGEIEDLTEILRDLVMIDGEEAAIGGGPGFKDRKAKAWARARERFEP